MTKKEIQKIESIELNKKMLKTQWILTIATIMMVIVMAFQTSILFKQTKILDRTSASKTAFLELNPSQFIDGNYYYYSTTPKIGDNNQVQFTILNTGSIDTGRISVIQENILSNFEIKTLIIENIPARQSNKSEINIKIINTTNIANTHDLLWKIYCANCFDQKQVVFLETKIIVPEIKNKE